MGFAVGTDQQEIRKFLPWPKVDIETVRRIGGWANYKELQKYLHPDDQASRDAVEAIGG